MLNFYLSGSTIKLSATYPMGSAWWTPTRATDIFHPANRIHTDDSSWSQAPSFSDWKFSAPEDYLDWKFDN